MLSRRPRWIALLALLLGSGGVLWVSPASAGSGLRRPERLTAGASDEFLGSLSPDGKALVYISNRNATAQVFRQAMGGGTPKLIVDDEADVSFPRLSPDGGRLLYISTREDAAGDLCIRPATGGRRRCLTGLGSAEVQAFWYPDSRSIGVVTRRGLDGSLELRKLPASGGDGVRVHAGNISSPALSPDGRWLAWVPIERATAKVGVAFSMRVGKGLRLRREGQDKEQEIHFDLPGVTGMPAFSSDSRWLFFSQYLSDTNFDGRIDGDDHSVLFRVRFQGRRDQPVKGARPSQLTSAHWNCQYPMPARDRLILTCHYDGSLDVYELPLDGAIPAGWKAKKLQEALDMSRDRWEQLMLLEHLGGAEKDARRRLNIWRDAARLHLSLRELASASFFVQRVSQHAKASAADRGWAAIVTELIAHRREERRLNRGQLNDRFIDDQWARLRRIRKTARRAHADVKALAILATVEILDLIGAEAQALKRLKRFDPKTVKDRFVLHLWADQPLRLLRDLGDREPVLKAHVVLAQHHAFTGAERLHFSEVLVDEILRGTRVADRPALIARWRKGLELDSEAAFRLQLEAELLRLRPKTRKAVQKAVYKLYRQHNHLPERRALVSAAVRRASETDSAKMLYTFANAWGSWVPRNHVERDKAVALYRQVVLERGYVRQEQKNWPHAFGSFFGLTIVTEDLEAWIGVIESAARAGRKGELEKVRKRYKKKPDHPVLRFVEAWTLVRQLPGLKDIGDRRSIYDEAEAHLVVAVRGLPRDPAVHHVRGYIAHQRFLDGIDRSAAFAAHAHYAMALDLANGNARFQAATLHAMGLLQAAVGNHWIALESFDARAALPFLSPVTELSLLLARARSLFHVGRAARAARTARDAYKLARKAKQTRKWVALTLDRAALYSHSAGEHRRGATLYRLLVPMLGKTGAVASRPANQLRAAVMEGAANLAGGEADKALVALKRADVVLGRVDDDALRVGVRAYERALELTRLDYRVTIDGLRAQAMTRLGRDDGARKALEQRRADLVKRLAEGNVDDVRVQLAAVEMQLASLAMRAAKKLNAARHLEAGLAHAQDFEKRTGTMAPPVRLALIRAYAELHLYGKVPLTSLRRDLPGELGRLYGFLCDKPDPKRSAERFVFAIYLALLKDAGK